MLELLNSVTEHATDTLRLRLMAPPPELRAYISGYYRTDVPAGVIVEDWLPPEEGNLRIGVADCYFAAIGSEAERQVPTAIVSGPTDKATYLRIGGGRFWGIGLTPAGWCRFVRRPACDFTNRFIDAREADMPEPLKDLLHELSEMDDDMEAAAAAINRTLCAMLGAQPPAEAMVAQIHYTIVTQSGLSVADHADRANMNLRTFGRFAARHLGFPPSVLLRRQRFLRSLAHYVLDPSMRWIESLDSHYFDQAHFIREFRAIMQMTPGSYAARPHPITTAAAKVIKAHADVVLQGLYHPAAMGDRAGGAAAG